MSGPDDRSGVTGPPGGEAEVRGWLERSSRHGDLVFLWIRTGGRTVQAVVAGDAVDAAVLAAAADLPRESTLVAGGVLRDEPRAPGGRELRVRDLEVLARADRLPVPPDIAPRPANLAPEHRHLALRDPRRRAVLRVRAAFLDGVRGRLRRAGCLAVTAPVLAPAGPVRAGFTLAYHGDAAVLGGSPRHHLEALAAALGPVHAEGPAFAAGCAASRRRLAEYHRLEAVLPWAGAAQAMDLAEAVLAAGVAGAAAGRRDDLDVLGRADAAAEAAAELERPRPRLTAAAARRRGPPTAPFLLTGPSPALERRGRDFLLIVPGAGEVLSGWSRPAAAASAGDASPAWADELDRFGAFPRAGFALGVDRAVAWLCGLRDAAGTVPFPRRWNILGP